MKSIFYTVTIAILSGITVAANAQTKIKDGTITSSVLPNANAILELESNNKGFLLPRIALTATTSFLPLSAHVAGMAVYNTATVGDVTPGYYYNDGGSWVKLSIGNPEYKEPWNIQLTTNPAETNTQHIYQMGSVAIGKDTVASGSMLDVNGSVRGGNASSGVVGINSLAIGDSVTASGDNATALGWHHIASGLNSMAWGGQPTHSTADSNRYNIASGTAATSWGYGNRSTSWGTTTWGVQNRATNPQATAFGTDNQSTGFWSTSFGQRNVASGNSSTAFGRDNISSSNTALAFGQFNIASGSNSTSFGNNTKAKGSQATASGQQNIAASVNETVLGRYNADTSSLNTNSWVATDGLLQIGNGTDATTRTNAITVLKNGNTAIGTHSAKPHSTLQVNGSFAASIRSVNGNVSIDGSDYKIVVRTTGTGFITISLPDPATCTGRMYVIQNMNGDGGAVRFNYPVECGNGIVYAAGTDLLTGAGASGMWNSGSAIALQSDGTVWTGITQ